MKILISAAETSSDTHGAELLKAIRKLIPARDSVEVFGMGGPKLRALGLESVVDAEHPMPMGFSEVVGHLPKIYETLHQLTEAAEHRKPDLAIVIDYPDFHFKLAKRLKKLKVPTLYYIPPKVWVWRQSRLKFLKKYFTRILCIFPFEEAFYKAAQVPATYVGNPLVDELPLKLSKSQAREELSRDLGSIGEGDLVLVLMPGSRKSELKEHLELMLDVAALTAEKLQSILPKKVILKVLLPFPTSAPLELLQARIGPLQKKYAHLIDVRVSQGNAPICLVAADVGLIKSGTSTLEAGLLGCPHTIVYKTTKTTAWIFKHLIRYRGPVGLVNLVSEDAFLNNKNYLITEVIGENVTLKRLFEETLDLFQNFDRRHTVLQGLKLLRSKILDTKNGSSPSDCAAREVLAVMDEIQSSRISKL